MPLASRLDSTGTLLLNGEFDEYTSAGNATFAGRLTQATSISTGILDEVTFNTADPEIKNLLAWSQDFTQWNQNPAPNNYTVNADSETAPDGSQTADLIIKGTTAGSSSIVYKLFSGSVNTDYVGSIYVKAGGYSKVNVAFANSAFNNVTTGGDFDLAAGTANTAFNGSTLTISDVGNGWYRCTVTATSDGDGGSYVFRVVPCNDTFQQNFAGDGTSGIYVWGAQVELGSVATIYQPKNATTVIDTGMRQRVDSAGNQYVSNIFDEFTGAPIVDGNLILWLDAGQSASYSGTGTTWTDLSTAGNNTDLENGTAFDAQGWMVFDGVDDFANTNIATSTFLPSSDFTITTTVSIDSYASIANAAGTVCGSFNYDGYGIWWQGSTTTLLLGCQMRGRATTTEVRVQQTVNLGQWYHAAMSYSSSQNFMRFYLDGVEANVTAAISGSYDVGIPPTIRLAVNNAAGGAVSPRHLPGRIGQVMIYDRALSADEILTNFNANGRRYGI